MRNETDRKYGGRWTELQEENEAERGREREWWEREARRKSFMALHYRLTVEHSFFICSMAIQHILSFMYFISSARAQSFHNIGTAFKRISIIQVRSFAVRAVLSEHNVKNRKSFFPTNFLANVLVRFSTIRSIFNAFSPKLCGKKIAAKRIGEFTLV